MGITQVIRKVSTVCAQLSRILETVNLRMCSDFLYQLRSHRRHFVKFVLCLCLFLCCHRVSTQLRLNKYHIISYHINMFKTIEEAAYCEIRIVSRFLNAMNVVPSEIHHQMCQAYGDNAMCDGMVRKWVRMFNEGREKMVNPTGGSRFYT